MFARAYFSGRFFTPVYFPAGVPGTAPPSLSPTPILTTPLSFPAFGPSVGRLILPETEAYERRGAVIIVTIPERPEMVIPAFYNSWSAGADCAKTPERLALPLFIASKRAVFGLIRRQKTCAVRFCVVRPANLRMAANGSGIGQHVVYTSKANRPKLLVTCGMFHDIEPAGVIDLLAGARRSVRERGPRLRKRIALIEDLLIHTIDDPEKLALAIFAIEELMANDY